MLKTEGVLHFTIPVKNLDRSEKFYTEILGFEKVGRTDRIVFLRSGNDFFNLTFSANPITLNPEGEHQIHSAFRVTPQTYEATIKSCLSRASRSSRKKTGNPVCSSAAAPIFAIRTVT